MDPLLRWAGLPESPLGGERLLPTTVPASAQAGEVATRPAAGTAIPSLPHAPTGQPPTPSTRGATGADLPAVTTTTELAAAIAQVNGIPGIPLGPFGGQQDRLTLRYSFAPSQRLVYRVESRVVFSDLPADSAPVTSTAALEVTESLVRAVQGGFVLSVLARTAQTDSEHFQEASSVIPIFVTIGTAGDLRESPPGSSEENPIYRQRLPGRPVATGDRWTSVTPVKVTTGVGEMVTVYHVDSVNVLKIGLKDPLVTASFEYRLPDDTQLPGGMLMETGSGGQFVFDAGAGRLLRATASIGFVVSRATIRGPGAGRPLRHVDTTAILTSVEGDSNSQLVSQGH